MEPRQVRSEELRHHFLNRCRLAVGQWNRAGRRIKVVYGRHHMCAVQQPLGAEIRCRSGKRFSDVIEVVFAREEQYRRLTFSGNVPRKVVRPHEARDAHHCGYRYPLAVCDVECSARARRKATERKAMRVDAEAHRVRAHEGDGHGHVVRRRLDTRLQHRKGRRR